MTTMKPKKGKPKHLTPDQLDERSDSGKSLKIWLGRKVFLHFGQVGTLVRHKTRNFGVRFRFGPCANCGKKSMTLYAVSGLHAGAWCYVYDGKGNYQANMRDDIYRCDCRKVDTYSKKEEIARGKVADLRREVH